ncbi:MAG: ROK family protein [Nocardioides sp.]
MVSPEWTLDEEVGEPIRQTDAHGGGRGGRRRGRHQGAGGRRGPRRARRPHRSSGAPGRRVSPAKVEDALVAAVLDAADGRRLRAVGVSAAGFVDAPGSEGHVRPAPALAGRAGPRDPDQAARGSGPFDNDANCAAWAEYRFGTARGSHSALMITLGTGIGGALVLEGQVIRGANGMAGEFGHMQMVADGLPCECGRRGCWEQYCSGNALLRYARARLVNEPSVMADMCDGVPGAAHRADDHGRRRSRRHGRQEAFADVGHWLGVGTANLVAAFDPEVVVIGGGVSDAGERLLDPARHALKHALVGAEHRIVPRLERAALGPQAGSWVPPRSRAPRWSWALELRAVVVRVARPRGIAATRYPKPPTNQASRPRVTMPGGCQRSTRSDNRRGRRTRRASRQAQPEAAAGRGSGGTKASTGSASASPSGPVSDSSPASNPVSSPASASRPAAARVLASTSHRPVGRGEVVLGEPGPLAVVVDDVAPQRVVVALGHVPRLRRAASSGSRRQPVTRATKSADSPKTVSASLSRVATW